MAKNRPGTIVWCMGQTQHTIGNAIVRASCILQLALGNIGVSGGGANIFRGHDNVQGATDVGPNPDSLPGYYGLVDGRVEALVRGLGRRLRVDQEAASPRKAMMEKPGMTVSRWIDGVLEKNEHIDQDPQPARDGLLGPRAQQPDARQGDERGDEEARPAGGRSTRIRRPPRRWRDVRKDGVYLLPACDAVRDLGLGDGVEPLAAVAREGDRAAVRVASPTTRSCIAFAKKFGFGKPSSCKNIKL